MQSGQNTVDGPCAVERGYDDQKQGAQVVITDASGTTIALGHLNEEGLQIVDGSTDIQDTWCGFSFSVPHVPTGENYYGVAIGNRDAIQFSEDEMFSNLDLSLGDVPGS
ncbi:hypothetical protein [Cellulomonas denverensis]|uniref:hypothetical protein n=1 Tax=Cellulomonas denverensis TaxID=264297 RepID=UPI000AEE6EF2